jgi:hypothetical protein
LYPLKQKLPFNMRYRGALRGRERTSFRFPPISASFRKTTL